MSTFVNISLADAAEAMGGFKWVARQCGVDLRTAYKWVHAETAIPPQRIPQIEAALVGMGGDSPRLLRELADVIEAQDKVMADGKITVGEAAFMRRQVTEAQIALEIVARRVEAGK